MKIENKGGIPHFIIGDNNKTDNINNTLPPTKDNPNLESPNKDNILSPKEELLIKRLKKWGAIIAIALVFGYAAYRILN